MSARPGTAAGMAAEMLVRSCCRRCCAALPGAQASRAWLSCAQAPTCDDRTYPAAAPAARTARCVCRGPACPGRPHQHRRAGGRCACQTAAAALPAATAGVPRQCACHLAGWGPAAGVAAAGCTRAPVGARGREGGVGGRHAAAVRCATRSSAGAWQRIQLEWWQIFHQATSWQAAANQHQPSHHQGSSAGGSSLAE